MQRKLPKAQSTSFIRETIPEETEVEVEDRRKRVTPRKIIEQKEQRQ